MTDIIASSKGNIIKDKVMEGLIDISVSDLPDSYFVELTIPKTKRIPCDMIYALSDVQAKVTYRDDYSGTEIEHNIHIV